MRVRLRVRVCVGEGAGICRRALAGMAKLARRGLVARLEAATRTAEQGCGSGMAVRSVGDAPAWRAGATLTGQPPSGNGGLGPRGRGQCALEICFGEAVLMMELPRRYATPPWKAHRGPLAEALAAGLGQTASASEGRRGYY